MSTTKTKTRDGVSIVYNLGGESIEVVVHKNFSSVWDNIDTGSEIQKAGVDMLTSFILALVSEGIHPTETAIKTALNAFFDEYDE